MNMEGRYIQDQTGSGFFFFFLCFHLKCIPATLSNCICCTCLLPGSCTDTAPATGQGREKGLQTSLRRRKTTTAGLRILPRLPSSAAGTESPADGSGRLKSSSAQSWAGLQPHSTCSSSGATKTKRLLPGPRCYHGPPRERFSFCFLWLPGVQRSRGHSQSRAGRSRVAMEESDTGESDKGKIGDIKAKLQEQGGAV